MAHLCTGDGISHLCDCPRGETHDQDDILPNPVFPDPVGYVPATAVAVSGPLLPLTPDERAEVDEYLRGRYGIEFYGTGADPDTSMETVRRHEDERLDR